MHWVSGQAGDAAATDRQSAVLKNFPELSERGLWRAFGLCRDLETVATRLQKARSSA